MGINQAYHCYLLLHNNGLYYDVRMTQKKAEVFEVTLADGRSVKATADYPILTWRDWVQIKYLHGDDEIARII